MDFMGLTLTPENIFTWVNGWILFPLMGISAVSFLVAHLLGWFYEACRCYVVEEIKRACK